MPFVKPVSVYVVVVGAVVLIGVDGHVPSLFWR
jgi:hypothetical protein